MFNLRRISRRDFFKLGASSAAVVGSAGTLAILASDQGQASTLDQPHHQGGSTRFQQGDSHESHSLSMTVGDVGPDAIGIDPMEFLTTFDYGTVSTLPNGQTLREYTIVAVDREIEIAPGVFFPAWTYNGQAPAATRTRSTSTASIRPSWTA
jgi:hypothetical protein